MRYAHSLSKEQKKITHQCLLFPQLPKLFLIAIPRNSMEEVVAQKIHYCWWHRLSIGCLPAIWQRTPSDHAKSKMTPGPERAYHGLLRDILISEL